MPGADHDTQPGFEGAGVGGTEQPQVIDAVVFALPEQGVQPAFLCGRGGNDQLAAAPVADVVTDAELIE